MTPKPGSGAPTGEEQRQVEHGQVEQGEEHPGLAAGLTLEQLFHQRGDDRTLRFRHSALQVWRRGLPG